MSDAKKLGVPFLIILVSALVTKLVAANVAIEMSSSIVKVLVVCGLCIFGAALNSARNKRSSHVWKKVLAILMIAFLLCMQLELFTFASVSHVFAFFGVDAFYINMMYIFCGYLLVD